MNDPVVYVVDDDPAARNSVAALIKSRGLAVETYPSAEEFLDRYDPFQRGCLIVDVRMTGMSGLDLQERLATKGVNLPVIVITGFADVPMAVRAMQTGAVTFLEKPCSEQEITRAIQTALDLEAQNNELRQRRAEIEENYRRITQAERDVLERIVLGMPNKEVASELKLGLRTVEQRRARIMTKMNVDSLAELVRMVLFIRPVSTSP
jgi:FixJ family two-component response regulator